MSDFTFSSAEIADLNSLLNPSLEFDDNTGDGASIYAAIINDITTESAGGADDVIDVPADGVDPAVWDWLNGAITVNQNTGFFGQFIVTYTLDGLAIRAPSTTFMNDSLLLAPRFLAYILFLFLLALLPGEAAFAQQTDPIQLCKTDRGTSWYFAIGRAVFEVKDPDYLRDGPLVNNIDPQYALTPPSPTSPVGCEGNPQQLANFSSLNWPRLEPEGYLGGIPQVVEALGIERYPYSNIVPPSIDPVIEKIRIIAENCQNKRFITRYEDGTILCADKEGQLNPILNIGKFHLGVGWEYIISGNLYHTPLGGSLVVSEETTEIDVSYRLSSDVVINYGWFPPKSASNIDADYLISVDKIFLDKLMTYEKDKYPWPLQVEKQVK